MMVETIKAKYGSFVGPKNDLITNQLIRFSAHTRNELAMIKGFIHTGDCIIDIGAHIGSFSIPFAQFVGDSGSIYSIEADPSNYEFLVKNIQLNKLETLITPIRAIVSDEKQHFKRVIDKSNNSGETRFIPAGGENADEVILIDKWHQTDLQGQKIDLIKIDIEGAELSALRSCRQLIQKHQPLLYFEVNQSALSNFQTTPADLEEFLRPLGYEFFRNVGPRNSSTDTFKIARVKDLSREVGLYDCLAVVPSSDRYPKKYLGTFMKWFWRNYTSFTTYRKKVIWKMVKNKPGLYCSTLLALSSH